MVLAALAELIKGLGLEARARDFDSSPALASSPSPSPGFALLSGGTDGEDGPTDAAGALIDAEVISRMRASNLDPADFLRRNDAYHFFDAVGGLIKTGPTHTNVCDVRVVVVNREP